ncbi:MAG: CRISPR-associated protein, partial [Bacteroidales bacterium]|nr:CRISPR-associated protein [Bacteroidales bacterium]
MESIYTHRFLARMIIEAKTPLAVGSGDKDITTDALVATDVNGLPYIPG